MIPEERVTCIHAAGRCQVKRCSLPPSSLPWLLDCGSVALELWLCHAHGELIRQGGLTFDDEAVA